MTRSRSVLVIGVLSAVLTACGSSQEGTRKPQQEPRPKIGLLMDTLKQGERRTRDRDLFLERAKELRAECWSNRPKGMRRSSSSWPTRCSNAACRRWWWCRTTRKPPARSWRRPRRNVGVISYDRLILKADIDLYLSTTTGWSGKAGAVPAQPGAEGELRADRRGAHRSQRQTHS